MQVVHVLQSRTVAGLNPVSVRAFLCGVFMLTDQKHSLGWLVTLNCECVNDCLSLDVALQLTGDQFWRH